MAREAATPKLVTTESLGNAIVPNQPFTNPGGSPFKSDTDFFGKKRDTTNPMPDPPEALGKAPATLKVWQVRNGVNIIFYNHLPC